MFAPVSQCQSLERISFGESAKGHVVAEPKPAPHLEARSRSGACQIRVEGRL